MCVAVGVSVSASMSVGASVPETVIVFVLLWVFLCSVGVTIPVGSAGDGMSCVHM